MKTQKTLANNNRTDAIIVAHNRLDGANICDAVLENSSNMSYELKKIMQSSDKIDTINKNDAEILKSNETIKKLHDNSNDISLPNTCDN